MKPINASKLIWIPVENNVAQGDQVNFPFQKELLRRKITGLTAVNGELLNFTPDGLAILTAFQNFTLTLKEDSIERHEGIPLNALFTEINAGIWKEIDPVAINWPNSFCTCTAATQAPFAIAFWVHYILEGLDRSA